MRIRDADPDRDAAACAEIYRPAVEGSPVSFEEEAPGAREMAERIADYARTHAWLVAEDADGVVMGYAYGCPHRTRAAYRWTAETAVYVAGGAHGRGIGAALYARLLDRLAERGYRRACAGVTLPNDASLALHRSRGFTDIGVFRAVGWKDGAWRDVAWLQRDLAPGAVEDPPREPA